MGSGHVVLVVAGVLVLTLIVVTVALVARDRPAQPRRSARERTRFNPRSMRGFDTMMRREVRRRGRRR